MDIDRKQFLMLAMSISIGACGAPSQPPAVGPANSVKSESRGSTAPAHECVSWDATGECTGWEGMQPANECVGWDPTGECTQWAGASTQPANECVGWDPKGECTQWSGSTQPANECVAWDPRGECTQWSN